jgi:hypothetical protein
MNQISEIFVSSDSGTNFEKASALSKYLIEKAMNYGTKNNLEIVTISHYCYWYQNAQVFGGHIIVVYRKINVEDNKEKDIKSINLLEFE